MLVRELTIDDFKHMLREAAGEDESADLDGDILDIAFDELGYDSLALLEVAALVQRRFAVLLAEDAVTGIGTPREFVGLVNRTLGQAA
ncbi:acyl carrier protein [Kutzneria sp. NPDC051319]|uniref:acyl carrier protein n=1 Tax=Kutzneria sp. NPDC051319 TaxID=3155047 RepID=UPI0034366E0B